MASVTWFNMDPADVADRGIDGWAKHLDLPAGVTIIGTPVWSVTPAGPLLVAAPFANDKASVRVSGVAAGTSYIATCRVATSDGQTFERSAALYGVDR